VHDWDSTAADSEAVLGRLAAALFSSVSPDEHATVAETESFLDAYSYARGRAFSSDELRQSWAAGVCTRAYDAKCQHAAGQPVVSLAEAEAGERLRVPGSASETASNKAQIYHYFGQPRGATLQAALLVCIPYSTAVRPTASSRHADPSVRT